MAGLLRIDDKDKRLLDVLSAGCESAEHAAKLAGLSRFSAKKKLHKLERMGMAAGATITAEGERLRAAIEAEIDLPAWERIWYKFAERNGFEVRKY